MELNPTALSQYGIALETVRSALAATNVNRPKGQLGDGRTRLGDRVQRSAPQGRGVRTGDRRLPIGAPLRLADVAAGRGLGRGRADDRARERPARGAAGDLPAARRQHHRHGRRRPRAAPAAPGRDPAGHHHVGGDGPDADDPRLAARRRADAGDLGAAGDAGRVRVPAEPSRHPHPRGGGAGLAGRHLRGDVRARLQPGQPVAHGADHRDRLRGRRRHRRPGERGAASGGRSLRRSRRRSEARGRSASRCSPSASRWSRSSCPSS